MRDEDEVEVSEKKVITAEKVPQGTYSLMFISVEYHWQQFRKIQRILNT